MRPGNAKDTKRRPCGPQRRKGADRAGEQGAALVLALALLAILAVMGTYYVRNMQMEADSGEIALSEARARLVAEAGVNDAVDRLSRAVPENAIAIAMRAPAALELPTYLRTGGDTSRDFAARETRRNRAETRMTDESARINLNLAPAPVLQAVLNVDAAKAGAVWAGIHSASPAWLAIPDDLVARGLLTPEEFAAVDRSLVTTISVADPAQPGSYFNINEAEPKAAAAALGVTVDAAAALLAQKPFRSLEALSAAAGKDLKALPETTGALPGDAFAFDTRCVRIVSEGIFAKTDLRGGEYHRAHARAEAVVRLNNAGTWDVVYWNTQRVTDEG